MEQESGVATGKGANLPLAAIRMWQRQNGRQKWVDDEGMRHLTTFREAKLQSAPGADNPRYNWVEFEGWYTWHFYAWPQHPVVQLTGTGDVVLVVLARAGQTNSTTTPDPFMPTSGDRPSYGVMVERRDGPSWLRDDDDDDAVSAADLALLAAASR